MLKWFTSKEEMFESIEKLILNYRVSCGMMGDGNYWVQYTEPPKLYTCLGEDENGILQFSGVSNG